MANPSEGWTGLPWRGKGNLRATKKKWHQKSFKPPPRETAKVPGSGQPRYKSPQIWSTTQFENFVEFQDIWGGELVTPSRSAPPCCIVLSFFWADFHLHRFGDRVGRFFKDHLLRLTSVQSLLSAETRNFFNRLFLPFQKGLNGYGSYIYFAFFCTKCCLLSPADQQFRTSRRFPKNPLIASCAAQLLGGGGIMTHHAIPFQKKSN